MEEEEEEEEPIKDARVMFDDNKFLSFINFFFVLIFRTYT
jgi:hypothetical protein